MFCRLARGHYGEHQVNVDAGGGQGHRRATISYSMDNSVNVVSACVDFL